MLDIRFSGNRFTWNHGASFETRRAAWLDRALSCVEWRRMFPSAYIRHLSHAHSDHCPVLLELKGRRSQWLGKRPFKFQALHKEFHKWMENDWADEGGLMESLKGFSEKLMAWNMDVFGSIFRGKKRVKNRLEGAMRAMDEAPSMGLFRL